MEFQIGDRVRFIGGRYYGETGTVLAKYTEYAVRFDNCNPYRHSLGGRCKQGHGWWCQEFEIESINDCVIISNKDFESMFE